MATIRVHHLAVVLSILLASGHVTSFSISRRSTRNTDLSDALAILQRQRRRVDPQDFYSSERLLESRPLTLDDVSDWLSRAEDNGDLDTEWLSDRGNFKDFEDDPDIGVYDLPPLVQSSSRGPEAEKASQKELDDIFSDDDEEEVSAVPEKKKKEEMVSVKGEKKMVKKKSAGTNKGLSLDTLTKEEYRALMKAVEKLQKQAENLEEAESIVEPTDVKETVVESVPIEEEMTIAEPVGEEELESVFDDGNGPIIKETKVTDEAVTGPDGEPTILETVETETVPADEETEEALKDAIASEIEKGIAEEEGVEEEIADKLWELEDDTPSTEMDQEKLASLGKYWLMNNYVDENLPQKRTAKRAVVLPRRLLDEASAALETALEEEDRQTDLEQERELEEEVEEAEAAAEEAGPDDEVGESVVAMTKVPTVDMFLRKILQLQDEVDRLKMVARLEDLENDVLTDALNEATLGQKEGTVSSLEFDSLQQAIQLEEALQDIKSSSGDQPSLPAISSDVSKRGEPWKRKRRPEGDSQSGSGLLDDVTSLVPAGRAGNRMSREDVAQLLNQIYLKEDDEEEDEEEEEDVEDSMGEVASLFLEDAGSCPAVREYSTNCELADLYSLPVDYEARALCNLHQMCYSCGHSLQVSQEECDLEYRKAAIALCDEKEACVVESEIFLRTMKLKTRYTPHTQPHCRSTCAARFLGML